MASGAVPPDFERAIQVIDSQGVARNITMGFLKSATPNQWHVEFYVRPAADVTVAGPLVDGQIGVGTMSFNPDGSFDAGGTTVPTPITVTWAAGTTQVDPSVIAFDFGTDTLTDGLTQFEAPSELTTATIDGRAFAKLSSISITEDGDVMGLFTNGLVKRLYRVPLATFTNPNGLANKTGNAFESAADSGPITLQEAGTNAGRVAPSSLEASTVDLGEEFTTMITVQRAFSAAARLITTSDDMLEELVRLKR
jgi:flagellar hook protein FlgE